jgi:riboflavin kinase/FMN adenylyltransferase
MRVLHQPAEALSLGNKACVAIGVFDGVHLGHQQVIRQMIADARHHEAVAIVATFDRHPGVVLAPERAPRLIYPLRKKLEVIEATGADAVWLIPFDLSFSRQTGEQFIRALAAGLGRLCSVCVGGGFVFGAGRSGNVDLLRRLGAELHFTVHALAAVSLDGEIVSSTRIREAIRAGQFDAAGQMLGRAYSLCGPVVRGDQLGRQLGFPTANLDVSGLELPPGGVYAAHAAVESRVHRAVVNIGHRPTLRQAVPQMRVEAHLLDFDADLYGREIELTFVERLRDERQFASTAELRCQINDDISRARHCFD